MMLRRGLNDPDLLMLWLNPRSCGYVLVIVGVVVICLFNVCCLVGNP